MLRFALPTKTNIWTE